MIPVESSNIKAIGYDPANKVLKVQFLSGVTWQYSGVPPEEHAALMDAESKGSYFARHIRDLYEASAVEEE